MALITVEEKDFAFQNRLRTFSIKNNGYKDLSTFFNNALDVFVDNVAKYLEKRMLIKLSACFVGEFNKTVAEGDQEKQNRYIHTPTLVVDSNTSLEEHYHDAIVTEVKNRIDTIELRGSGFVLSRIIELNIQISSYEPLAGSSYIPTPHFLSAKHALINVQNKVDKMCFKWSVLAALYSTPTAKNRNRISLYAPYSDELDFTGIEFPVRVDDINLFEDLNPTLGINVYTVNKDGKNSLYRLRATKYTSREKIINLLLLTEGGRHGVNSHYCCITRLDALLGCQLSQNRCRKYLCQICLAHFSSGIRLEAHTKAYGGKCLDPLVCDIEMPSPDNDNHKLYFKNHRKQLISPFIIYADVESLLKTPDKEDNFCVGENAKTTAYQQHEAYSIGYYLKCVYDESKSQYHSYRGEDCIDLFIKDLRDIASYVEEVMEDVKPMKLTSAEEADF